MRMTVSVGVVFVGFVVNLLCGAGFAQASGSASSYASSGEPARAMIGTFVFEQGSTLALEIEREEPCPCLCEPLFVTGLRVLDCEGNTVFTSEEVDGGTIFPVAFKEWTGCWGLVNQLGEPVPEGTYSVVVKTSIGEFRACIQVVAPGMKSQMGRVSSKALVCGAGLTIYRLADDKDDGGQITLNEGERLMIALSGNATTGYEWEIETEPHGGILQGIDGPGYRPSSTLIGAGGTFYFRYEAIAAGQGELTLAYRRPWEAAPPERTFTIIVAVR